MTAPADVYVCGPPACPHCVGTLALEAANPDVLIAVLAHASDCPTERETA